MESGVGQLVLLVVSVGMGYGDEGNEGEGECGVVEWRCWEFGCLGVGVLGSVGSWLSVGVLGCLVLGESVGAADEDGLEIYVSYVRLAIVGCCWWCVLVVGVVLVVMS